MLRPISLLSLGILLLLGGSVLRAGPLGKPTTDEKLKGTPPHFAEDGKLERPDDYREWVFVTSGLGMTYNPDVNASTSEPRFDNVFVTRDAYRSFLETGNWPNRTMFILEVREAQENTSINRGGRTQGRLLALEAAVKDQKRFQDAGWAYYSFDGSAGLLESASALPSTASCYSCHREKAAVENTFVQFYPTLFEAAERHGTIRSDYDPSQLP